MKAVVINSLKDLQESPLDVHLCNRTDPKVHFYTQPETI